MEQKIKTREVRSAFGIVFVKSNWSDEDWDRYHFNLKLRDSVFTKALLEGRNPNRDEKKFSEELEQENDKLRSKYMTKKEIWGI